MGLWLVFRKPPFPCRALASWSTGQKVLGPQHWWELGGRVHRVEDEVVSGENLSSAWAAGKTWRAARFRECVSRVLHPSNYGSVFRLACCLPRASEKAEISPPYLEGEAELRSHFLWSNWRG